MWAGAARLAAFCPGAPISADLHTNCVSASSMSDRGGYRWPDWPPAQPGLSISSNNRHHGGRPCRRKQNYLIRPPTADGGALALAPISSTASCFPPQCFNCRWESQQSIRRADRPSLTWGRPGTSAAETVPMIDHVELHRRQRAAGKPGSFSSAPVEFGGLFKGG